jgi:uncharacterized membrane protein HdeD (DUF308 family)
MTTAAHTVKRVRWAIGINGVLSVLFGAMLLAWPGIGLYALTILFGAYATASGVVGLMNVASVKEGRGWTVLSSLLGIGVGLAVIAIGSTFWLPIDGEDAVLLSLSGLVSILFGLVMFVKPDDGALVLLTLIAAFSLVKGITELVVAIDGARIMKREHDPLTGAIG